MRAKAPIVPVAIVDSWKVFDLWSLRKVKTEVFYLKPMFYDEYKDKKSVEISSIVYNRICSAVDFAQKGEFDKALLQKSVVLVVGKIFFVHQHNVIRE